MVNLFIELLQVSLGTRESISMAPSAAEWDIIYDEARRQAILGVMLCGLERLPKEQHPPQEILFKWIGLTIKIEQRNALTSKACKAITERFAKDGFNACILKGQANHRYYPEGMAKRRSCGDVDVWVVPKGGYKHPVRRVLEYVNGDYEMDGLCWLHCNYTEKNGVPVEVHFRPSFMNEPCKNRHFLRHFADIEKASCQDEVDGVVLSVMKIDEDVIYQMNHIYRHLIDEGVGLRQIIDYYWLLIAWNKQHTRSKEETMTIVSHLGMKRFAGALMFVLREICGVSEELLLCPVSLKDGHFLMNELLTAGNFGHSDPRMKALSYQSGLKRQMSQAARRFRRNIRFLTSYPGEVIWEPFARLFHFAWKKYSLYANQQRFNHR